MTSAQITTCPPSPQHIHFDNHSFDMRPNAPVSSRYMGLDRWDSNGISFDVYATMHTERRKTSGGRRLKIPTWAVNDAALQSVIVTYLERRAYGTGKKLKASGAPLSIRERLKRAEQRLRERAPNQMEVCDNLCREYVGLQRAGGDPARIEMLARQIQSLDCQILFNRQPAALVATILYMYYRAGNDSVHIASAVGMRSPAIRQILYRIWQVAKEQGFEAEVQNEYKRSRRQAERAA